MPVADCISSDLVTEDNSAIRAGAIATDKDSTTNSNTTD
jgi:hypothetical protein